MFPWFVQAVAVSSSAAGLASVGRYKGHIISLSSLGLERPWGRGFIGSSVAVRDFNATSVFGDDQLSDCSMPTIGAVGLGCA